MWSRCLACGLAGLLATMTAAPAAQDRPSIDASRVDAVFAKWTLTTPGCAVGVTAPGQPTFTRAYGLADLEHSVPLTPTSVFEAGSVSKQFTAAAVLLLAREGKLSLDDPVRKFIPEIPDYGTPLTIRHVLMHTSGLRDWGSVADIAGRPRWTRVYTQEDVVDIARRQRTLNFVPGTRWSYTNTGYNLAALIVVRVSGRSFDDFTRTRMFEPLGMTKTSWDTDHTRPVAGRAIGYDGRADGFRTFMPMEDVYGNRGLLTTVGDLLKWNDNFSSGIVGGLTFVAELQQPGRLADGRAHGYAFGLFEAQYKGLREIGHGGGTAGYRTDLIRFPDQRVSVAVLCNSTSADTTAYAHAVADLWLNGDSKQTPSPQSSAALTSEEMAAAAGTFKYDVTGRPMRIVQDGGTLHLNLGGAVIPLTPMSPSRFGTPFGVTLTLDGPTGAILADESGTLTERYTRVSAPAPTLAQLKDLMGTYSSEEADATVTIELQGTSLFLTRRPATRMTLIPQYPDAFIAPEMGTLIFRRDRRGTVQAFSVVTDRVWDLRFTRVR